VVAVEQTPELRELVLMVKEPMERMVLMQILVAEAEHQRQAVV
jgi:hypothetical protein